nr:hypothetical protein [Oscillospiraceae bacterium]
NDPANYGIANGCEPLISEGNYAKKSEGYKNEYTAYNLTFGKAVTGNQGSRDKYFKFTVNISGATAGSIYDLDIDADATVANNNATKSDYIGKKQNNDTGSLSITVGSEGTASAVFYLRHGQYITIKGLAAGTKYEVIEEKEDYTQEALIGESGSKTVGGIESNQSLLEWDSTHSGYDALTDPTSSNNAGITSDVHTGFTNTREGTVPTGVLISVAAPTFVGLGAAAGIIYLLTKKKKKDEE